MPTPMDMYNCIEAERTRNKWTIEEFSKKIGISEKTYRNWRDNEKPLNTEVLIKMSQVFKCSVDYLLGLSDKIRI
jgi:transcriptional regulator with XRE-family HTH domain